MSEMCPLDCGEGGIAGGAQGELSAKVRHAFG
jgi:hypothetical protein